MDGEELQCVLGLRKLILPFLYLLEPFFWAEINHDKHLFLQLGKAGWTTDRILVVSSEWRAEWLNAHKQE